MTQEERLAEDQKWLDGLADRRKQELAELRWKHETGGAFVQVDGFADPLRINSSAESQSKLSTAFSLAKVGAVTGFPWKTLDGFVELTAAQIIQVFTGVVDHVQGCFAREVQLIAEINAAPSPQDVQAIVFDGWPISSIYEDIT